MTIVNPGRPRIVALANNNPVNSTVNPAFGGGYDSTLGGIANLHGTKWASDLLIYSSDGAVSSRSSTQHIVDMYALHPQEQCPSFRNPHDDMVADLNRLMVYVGAIAAREDRDYLTSHMDPGMEINGTVPGIPTNKQSIYHTDFRFWGAAVFVEVICIALVMPTYWNWWKLGRDVSFSPLEIAKVRRYLRRVSRVIDC